MVITPPPNEGRFSLRPALSQRSDSNQYIHSVVRCIFFLFGWSWETTQAT